MESSSATTEPQPAVPSAEEATRALTVSRRYFEFPADVANKYALREKLSQTDVFGPATAEAKAYLDESLERFRITMALIPELPACARILELGANPYFLTRLLRERCWDVTAANWFGERSGFGHHGCQQVFESGIPHEYTFDHFNIEEAAFPYEDGTFDLVLFCEILEHLPYNPTHTLVEIHRVLREGALMLLTTPNANRLENLVKVHRGENIYEQLSGYGVYGRHNREYTVRELTDLLQGCGYDIEEIFGHDITARSQTLAPVPGATLEDRGENLFVLARAQRAYRWYYPTWLYQSIQAYRRIVQPDLVVGVNCDLQADGVHHLENIAGRPSRWTIGDRETTVLLSSPTSGLGVLRIEGRTSDFGGLIEIRAATAHEELAWTLPCDGAAFTVEGGAHLEGGDQSIRIWTDRFWRPAEEKKGSDHRTIGFILQRVAIIPQFGKPVGRNVVVGSNCDVQLYGVHPLEDFRGEPARWTDGSERTLALLVPDASGKARLTVEGCTPDLGGEVRLFTEINRQTNEWPLPADGYPFSVSATVMVNAGEALVSLWTDRPWCPQEEKQESDDRTLGLLLHSITIENLTASVPERPSAAALLARKAFHLLPAGLQNLVRAALSRVRC